MKKDYCEKKELLLVGIRPCFLVKNLMWIVVLIFGAAIFTACDEDNSTPEIKSVKDVDGKFYGTVDVERSEASEYDNTLKENEPDICYYSLTVANDTLYFENFPIEDLLPAMVSQGVAYGLIQRIGNVKYKVGYTGTFNDDFRQIKLALHPKLWEIDVPFDPLSSFYLTKIQVEFDSSSEAYYDYEKQGLYIQLKVKSITTQPGETLMSYPSLFTFKMKREMGEWTNNFESLSPLQ